MAEKKPIKISIILIHNNNRERYNYISPQIDRFKKELLSDFEIDFSEISKQPEIVPNKTFQTIYKKYLLWKISREWTKYLLHKPRIFFLDLLFLLGHIAKTLKNRKLENWRSGIDMIVTDKHIRAWNNFLENETDLLMCFEDDAIFNDTSVTDFKKILRGINKFNNKLIYLNFTSGCSPEELKFEKIELKKESGRTFYSRPVTNTGCCYMINRKLASVVLLYLLKNPELRLLTLDWLVNKIFILTYQEYKYYCYHAEPSIFEHGSIKGNYKSWLSLGIK